MRRLQLTVARHSAAATLRRLGRLAHSGPLGMLRGAGLECTPTSEAEGVGFEPTGHCCPLVFKTRSIGRSDNPPDGRHEVAACVEQASSLADSTVELIVQQRMRRSWIARLRVRAAPQTRAEPAKGFAGPRAVGHSPGLTEVVVSPAASRTSCGPCSIATARPPFSSAQRNMPTSLRPSPIDEDVRRIDARATRARAPVPCPCRRPAGRCRATPSSRPRRRPRSARCARRGRRSPARCRRARPPRCGRPGWPVSSSKLTRSALERFQSSRCSVYRRRPSGSSTMYFASGRCSRRSVSTSVASNVSVWKRS